MSRRPATVTQADVARIVRAAKQAGAAEVEVRVGQAIVTVRMASTGQATPADTGEIIRL
tara:strand:- start:1337 stop:1513 length:177 start_codon:yes stop_codon:yes gene_type:complete